MCGEQSSGASEETGTWKPAAQIRDASIGTTVEQYGSLAASMGLLENNPGTGVCSLQCSVPHPDLLQPGGGAVPSISSLR